MDQIHLPDPVLEDINNLREENRKLANRVIELENELRKCHKNCEGCEDENI